MPWIWRCLLILNIKLIIQSKKSVSSGIMIPVFLRRCLGHGCQGFELLTLIYAQGAVTLLYMYPVPVPVLYDTVILSTRV